MAAKGKAQTGVFVKTKLCANFPNCPYGNKCTFAHGEQDLGAPVPSLSKGGQQPAAASKCSKPKGQPSGGPKTAAGAGGKGNPSPGVKMKLCANFPNCSFGDKCTFAHGQHEIGQPIPAQGAASKGGRPKGRPSGAAQAKGGPWAAAAQKGKGKVASGVKRKLCANFPNCSFGDRCSFAHGEHELGQPIPSLEPGAKRQNVDDGITPMERLQMFRKAVIVAITKYGGGMPLNELMEVPDVAMHKRGSCSYLDVLGMFPQNFSVQKLQGPDGELEIILESDDATLPTKDRRLLPDRDCAVQTPDAWQLAQQFAEPSNAEPSTELLQAFRIAAVNALGERGGQMLLKDVCKVPDVAHIVASHFKKLPVLQWLRNYPEDFIAESDGEGFKVFLLNAEATSDWDPTSELVAELPAQQS